MTDWEGRYQAGDTPWEKGTAAPPLIELLEKHGLAFFGNERVLVPGCGTGHDVRALAECGIEVLGLDLAPLAIARANAYACVGKERYELADFLDPAWHQEKSFSAIWEHTCFCAIDPLRRGDYAAACANLIEPGGYLVGVFFLTPQGLGAQHQGPPFNSSITELEQLFGRYFERIDAWVPAKVHPGREGQEWLAVYRRLGKVPIQ